jgi:two-component system chemotaxis response regulator CheB
LGPECDLARTAKAAGAVEMFPKPAAWTPTQEAQLRRSVRLVRGVQVVRHGRGLVGRSPRAGGAVRSSGGAVQLSGDASPPRLVAIAASTGGPAALATVLAGLVGIEVPVLVIQHIHRDFVDGLIAWMDRVSAVPVRLAVGGERLQPATVYFGPGGVHLKVAPGLRIVLDSQPASHHRPSADELFFSVAEYAGADGIGVILTGMGNDGTEGLLALRRRGGLTIAQDEATSAVFGMPRAALMAGAASQVLPVDEIAAVVVAASQRSRA